MGSGAWTSDDYEAFAKSRGRVVDSSGAVAGSYNNQDIFRSRDISAALNPRGVIRECCDSPEHPATVPVILALDVTGSMGKAAVEVAMKLNVIMTNLYDQVKDVEFMIMGIGDMACNKRPLQMPQFESDIRIADQLEQLYFEFGGGGNGWESYSLAWYAGLHHTRLDCWQRGKKGIIITMGDEMLNPYIPVRGMMTSMQSVLGGKIDKDIDTASLYAEASKMFEIFHLHIQEGLHSFEDTKYSFSKYLDNQHLFSVDMEMISAIITKIVLRNMEQKKAMAADIGGIHQVSTDIDSQNIPIIGW